VILLAGLPAGVRAQPADGMREVSPKILAFLKPAEATFGDSELQQKYKERHNVAVKLLEERVNEYKKGVRDISFVFEAARLTAETKMDLAENVEARIGILTQLWDMAKVIEDNLKQQIDKGFGSKAELERARFARLTVEIELIKEKRR
jgi:Na+/phosphate symporter